MTNDEKIKRHDALIEIRQRIGGCFGTADKVFAGHQNDEDRAKELRKLAADAGVTLGEILDIVAGYLQRTGFPKDHIDKQMKRASDLFGKKLN